MQMNDSNYMKSKLARIERSAKRTLSRKRDENGRFIPIHPFFKKERPTLDDLIKSTYIDELG